MANWYIWSGATGTGTGADWTNAFTTLTAAMNKAAGDVFYVAHDHAQTQATSVTANYAIGTEANPNRMYCVDRAGSVPPVAADLRTTATVTTTTNASITFTGAFSEVYGIIFSAGSGASAGSILLGASNRTMRFVNCSMRLGTTAAAAQINVTSATGALAIFENTTTYDFLRLPDSG